jgi:hypothetical protein
VPTKPRSTTTGLDWRWTLLGVTAAAVASIDRIKLPCFSPALLFSLCSNGWRCCHHRLGLCRSVLVISLWMDGGVGGAAAPFDGVANYKGPKQKDLTRISIGTAKKEQKKRSVPANYWVDPPLASHFCGLPTRVQCVGKNGPHVFDRAASSSPLRMRR